MTPPPYAFTAPWLVWAATWLLAVPWTRRTIRRQPLAGRLLHILPAAAGASLFFLAPGTGGPLGATLLGPGPAVAWTGLVLTLTGLGFSLWSRYAIGRLWSGTVTLKADHALVDTGPYAITRHPIYTGLLLALLGTALARDTAAAVLGLLLITTAFLVKIRQEELLLLGHFGAAYEEYRQRVPPLVPFLRQR